MKKKKEKGSHNPEKYVELNPTDEPIQKSMKEAEGKTVVLTFGRLNPITVGHEKLVNKVLSIATKEKATPQVYLSHTQDKKKNPLSYDEKLKYARLAFGSVVQKSNAKTIIQVAKDLSNTFDRLILVVGQDRVSEFETLLNKYNGKEYNYSSIRVLSAGDRDPDSDDVTGMSASKMRTFAMTGNFEQFKKGLPRNLMNNAEAIYKDVREGMGIMEELDEARQPLTIAQRRKRGMVMRRYRSKIKLAREKAKRKMATPEKLKMRAQRKARGIIRDRLMKNKKYSEMTPVEKIALDRRLSKISPTAISRIATRQLPIVRKAELQRLSDLHKVKNEQIDLNTLFEQFVNEPGTPRRKKFRYMFTREGKVNCDKRFKMFRPKELVFENFSELESELFDLIESTEDFIERLDKTDPLNREYGTDSLVKILKKDTPGEDLDEARMIPPIKHAKTTVHDFVEPSTPDISAMVSKHNKHQLGIGLNLKQMIQHAIKNKDLDNDGDVDAQDKKAAEELTGDPSFDRIKNATQVMQKKYEKEKSHTKPGLAFEGANYYRGLAKSTSAKRKAHFKKGAAMDDDNPAAYEPAPGDARAETKPSVHTKNYEKRFKKEEVELFESDPIAGIKKKAEETGIAYGILKQVFRRGVAAWRTGHRPGTTPAQWGMARINSFATGGKTQKTADADLWAKHKGK
jgi:hypothetical protein